jgi:hypothetical protein
MTNEPGDNITPNEIPTMAEAERLAAVAAAIDRLDLGAIIEVSADEALALIREELRGENTADLQAAIRREILAEYLASMERERPAAGQRLRGARMNARGFDPDDPAQVEGYVVSQLEGIDFEKLISQQERLVINKARGRVNAEGETNERS